MLRPARGLVLFPELGKALRQGESLDQEERMQLWALWAFCGGGGGDRGRSGTTMCKS